MIRTMMIPLVLAAIVAASPPRTWAQEPAAAEAAPQAQQAPADKPADFHLGLGDVKDLRDADITLPDIGGELAPPATRQQPAPAPDSQPGLNWHDLTRYPWDKSGWVSKKLADVPLDALGQPQQPDQQEDQEEDEGPQINPEEVVKRIIDNMGTSQDLLSRDKETGEKTQTVQGQIVKDLSDLIEYVKQKQSKSQGKGQSQGQQKSDSQKMSQGGQQAQGRGQGRRPMARRGSRPMQDEYATKGSVQEAELADVQKLLEERWGDLMPNAARETLQGIQDMILPKYRDLLSRYFYELARQGTRPSGAGD